MVTPGLAQQLPSLLIRHASVVDVRAGQILVDHAVLGRGEWIERVGPDDAGTGGRQPRRQAPFGSTPLAATSLRVGAASNRKGKQASACTTNSRSWWRPGSRHWPRFQAARAAMFLGRDGRTGVIAAGAEADLVRIEGDPLTDITAASRIHGVMTRGTWLTPYRPRPHDGARPPRRC